MVCFEALNVDFIDYTVVLLQLFSSQSDDDSHILVKCIAPDFIVDFGLNILH